MRRAVLACLVLLAPTVGCLGADEGPPSGSTSDGTRDGNASAGIEAPTWSIGDHWTYRTGDGAEQTWAVTGETADAWIVDTDSREAAFFDARFDVSFFGERGKTDIAGSQAGQDVRFFDWPLEANKSWTTTWDGAEREITVDRVEDGTAYLTARQDGRVAVEYTYEEAAGHFGHYRFLDENGTEIFSAELTASGADYQGTLVRWQLDEAVNEAGTFDAQPASFGFGFAVPENATDLWLAFTVDCPGQGGYDLGFGPSGDAQAEGSSYGASDVCPAEAAVEGVVVEEPTPGEYRGGFTASSAGAEGSYSITLFVRTLQEVAVGEG